MAPQDSNASGNTTGLGDKGTYYTKLDRIMVERKLTVGKLNEKLKSMDLQLLDTTAFGKYRKGKTGINAKLNSNKKWPSVLERICLALECNSSDILEY